MDGWVGGSFEADLKDKLGPVPGKRLLSAIKNLAIFGFLFLFLFLFL